MDPDPNEIPDETPPFVQACPACFGMVQIPLSNVGQTIFCPHCGESFTAAGAGSPTDFVHADQADEEPEEKMDEADRLSLLRIQNLSRERRAAWRTTTYYIAATGGCILAIAEIAYRMFPGFGRFGAGMRAICLLLIATCFAGAVYFLRGAVTFSKIAHRRFSEEPLKPPDFSTLSDGSQQVKNLEEMGRKVLETPKPGQL